MTKEELFKKYSIDESHSAWDNHIDNWMSVEIYRIMHNGELPKQGDMDVKYICEFLDKFNTDKKFASTMMARKQDDWGSLYLTAKREIYQLHEQIIEPKTTQQ